RGVCAACRSRERVPERAPVTELAFLSLPPPLHRRLALASTLKKTTDRFRSPPSLLLQPEQTQRGKRNGKRSCNNSLLRLPLFCAAPDLLRLRLARDLVDPLGDRGNAVGAGPGNTDGLNYAPHLLCSSCPLHPHIVEVDADIVVALLQKTWCVAKPSSDEATLLGNINYACSQVDCSVLQRGRACFYPDNLMSHASIAMNLYYQSRGRNPWNCFFKNSGLLVATDPSEISDHVMGAALTPRTPTGTTNPKNGFLDCYDGSDSGWL
ncbi:hypothetical protein BHM03_00032989, partial [Ensete ventricosum]